MRGDAKAHYDRRIAELTAELEAAKALRHALDNPTVVAELAQFFGSNGSKPSRNTKKSRTNKARGNYGRIMEFFEARSNEWASVPQIIEGTGLSRGNASNALYTAHKDDFEWKDNDNPKVPGRKLVRPKAGRS